LPRRREPADCGPAGGDRHGAARSRGLRSPVDRGRGKAARPAAQTQSRRGAESGGRRCRISPPHAAQAGRLIWRRRAMKTLKSYVLGSWQEGKGSFVTLVDPSTEEEIARASSEGIDFAAVLAYARERGGPALRAMSFGQRAALLKEMSKVLRDHRDELL